MKTVNEVLKETGLTYPMLNRLKDLGIVPKPKLKGLGRARGTVGIYEDEVINIINSVKLERKTGLSLTQIAERFRAERESLKSVEPQYKVLIPVNPTPLKSYIKSLSAFHAQIEKENPGYEVHSVELESIERDGKKFLIPLRITMRPKR